MKQNNVDDAGVISCMYIWWLENIANVFVALDT